MSRAAVIVIVLLAGGCGAPGDDPRLAQSRALADAFQQQLGGDLQTAMARGGPIEAVSVCREVAPAIAEQFSAQSQADVGRTALRVRNPENAADPQARSILEEFERRLAVDPDTLPEHFAAAADGSARYLRAIVLQPMCAACHGEVLAPEVVGAVARHYPDDQATGFAVGDLRGAFLIDWPAGRR
jgi:hypothetical protein